LRIVVLSVKVFFVIVFFMIVRWSWPRFRFDQLMDLAWKVMLPLGLLNFAAVAVLLEFGDRVQASTGLDGRLLLVAGGWAVLAAGWVYTAVASPFQTDNRPRTLPAELAESTRIRGLPR
jgi:NADH-quinone oxidoreductase subunit H